MSELLLTTQQVAAILGRPASGSSLSPLTHQRIRRGSHERSYYRATDVEFCRQLMELGGYSLAGAVREVLRVEPR